MNVRFLYACLTAIICCTLQLEAQRTLPIGALPTKYNGGFAGEAGTTRVASFSYLKYSGDLQGVGFSHSNIGTLISVDHFLKKMRSGIAVTAGLENYYSAASVSGVSAVLSPKFSFKGKYTFAPFVDFSYGRFHNGSQQRVIIAPTPTSDFVMNNFKTKSGFLINSRRAYIGLSVDVVNYGMDYNALKEKWRTLSEMTYVIQTGYTFQQTPESKFSFTPQLAFSIARHRVYDPASFDSRRARSTTDLIDLNLMFRYGKYIGGSNIFGLVLGYQTDKFKLQVSNAYLLKFYTGSISLRYVFKKIESVKMPGF
jgi:hypothetical protein